MHRVTALAALALAVVVAGCDDSREARPSPLAPTGASLEERRLAVDAAGSDVARLRLTVEGRTLREPLAIELESRDGEPLVGALGLPAGDYGVVAEGFDVEGRPMQVGKGELRVLEEETPQVEIAMAPEPGAGWAFVRIGTYRLAASRAIVPVRPRQEVSLELALFDADGRELPIEEGSLEARFPDWPREIEPIEIKYGGYKAWLAWVQQLGSPSGWLYVCQGGSKVCGRIQLVDASRLVAVSAGGHLTCVLRGSGNARCWGPDANGETGTDSSTNHLAGHDFVHISTGTSNHALGTHACAVDRAGGVWCWGRNVHGQLGSGTTATQYDRQPVPQQVSLPGAATQVAAGGRHSCALMGDGTVRCWGEAKLGQLGDGSYRTNTAGPANATQPVLVVTPERFTSISAGNAHTCGLTASGQVFCWGRNVEAQAGVSLAQSVPCNWQGLGSYWERCVPLPTLVQGAPAFVAFEAGTFDGCGRTATREAWCWGNSVTGASGGAVHTPTLIGGGVPWAHVSIGGGFACGYDDGGWGACWGANYGGQLGTGAPTTYVKVPKAASMAGGRQWARMDSGDDHACAIRASDAKVMCWGIDNYGTVLGFAHPGATYSATPQLVTVPY